MKDDLVHEQVRSRVHRDVILTREDSDPAVAVRCPSARRQIVVPSVDCLHKLTGT